MEKYILIHNTTNIPKKILDELDIKEDDTMILYVEGNKIILEKKEKKRWNRCAKDKR